MFTDQNSTSLLAVATTIHLCLTALRNHRQAARGVSPLALISFAFSALPWVFPSTTGVLGGLALHAAWFVACEWLAPPRVVSAAPVDRPRPAAIAAVASTPAASKPAAPAATPKGFIPAPILATFDETSDIKTIRVARPDGFDFEAGQFVTVRVRIDGRDYSRCYSISSSPAVPGYLEISVKKQGVVSNALHAMARPGGSLHMRAPAGAFRYPTGDDRPILLIGAGVGITPLMSILRRACATEPARPVTLVYGVRTESDFAFRDELHGVARRHPQVRMYFAASRGATQPHVYPGRIDETLLEAAAPSAAHSLIYVCGPQRMIEDVRAILGRRGVPAAQVRFELFEAAIAASAAVQSEGPAAPPARASAKAHAVTCARSGKRVSATPGQTLLEAAEAGGVEISSLCRAGVCGTCRLQVVGGDVRCESTTLSDDEIAAGIVLACVSTVASDCTVDA